MTLNEAIAHAREVAKEQRKDYDNCEYKSEYGCGGCADYYSKPCIECAEEYEQLAEWLEELKVIKDGSIPIIHGKAELELHDNAIRNKAIDDFVKFANTMPTVEEEDGTIRPMWLEEMAERLKAGVENE